MLTGGRLCRHECNADEVLVGPPGDGGLYSTCRGGISSQWSNELTMLRTIAPINAAPNPRTSKPGTNADANSSIMALMTNQKRPSVRIVSGKVRILRTSPMVALINPIASAAIKAAVGPLT